MLKTMGFKEMEIGRFGGDSLVGVITVSCRCGSISARAGVQNL